MFYFVQAKGIIGHVKVTGVTKSSLTLRVPIAQSEVMLEAKEQGTDAPPGTPSNSYSCIRAMQMSISIVNILCMFVHCLTFSHS